MGKNLTALSEKSEVVFRSPYIWALSAVLFGLLYIPAFMYGFFWLWIAPFTAVIILFLRAMIDDAIARVAQKGDAAVQAKAMIPEFIKMNIVMTVLLSLPFVSALWLSHAGYIQVIQQSEIDRELWRFCWWILRDQSYYGKILYPQNQITFSSMFFMYFSTLVILLALWSKLRKLTIILFHKETYGFLRKVPSSTSPISYFGMLVILFHIIVMSMQEASAPSIFYSLSTIFLVSFLIQYQTNCFVSYWTISKIQASNLTISRSN